MTWLDEAIAQAADAQPQLSGPVLLPVVRGRELLVDGDYLAYYCAGKDDTDPGVARRNAISRLETMRDAAGCEKITVHLTSQGSTKGDRFIIAAVQPYQGKRSGRHPKNWAYLRDWLEGYTGELFRPKIWGTREADDGMAYHASVLGVDKAVIATADKDLRMVPAWHLSWKHWFMTCNPDAYEVIGADELVYGTKWFWLQLLQGDSADHIPGLPGFWNAAGKLVQCGQARAEKWLTGTSNDSEALTVVAALYFNYYKDDWADQLVEQMALLWMRRDKEAEPDSVVHWLNGTLEWDDKLDQINQAGIRLCARIEELKQMAEGK